MESVTVEEWSLYDHEGQVYLYCCEDRQTAEDQMCRQPWPGGVTLMRRTVVRGAWQPIS